MVGNLMKVMTHLTPGEQKAWLQLHQDYNYCQAKEDLAPGAGAPEISSSLAHVAAFRKWNALIPNPGRISGAANQPHIFKQLFESSLSYSQRIRHAPCIRRCANSPDLSAPSPT